MCIPHLTTRGLTLDGSIPKLERYDLYGQRHCRLAALATAQQSGPGDGGLFPVTAERHFSKSFVSMLQMGMLVASFTIIAAVNTIARTANCIRILVLFLPILSCSYLHYHSPSLSLNSIVICETLKCNVFIYSNVNDK